MVTAESELKSVWNISKHREETICIDFFGVCVLYFISIYLYFARKNILTCKQKADI